MFKTARGYFIGQNNKQTLKITFKNLRETDLNMISVKWLLKRHIQRFLWGKNVLLSGHQSTNSLAVMTSIWWDNWLLLYCMLFSLFSSLFCLRIQKQLLKP